MNSKGQKGRCIYNCKWELDSQYKGWVSAFKADKRKALCKSCDRLIDISSMGESALKSHMKGEKHRLNSRCEQQVTLSSFGFGSCTSTSTSAKGDVEMRAEASQQAIQSQLTVPPPPEDVVKTPTKSQASMKGFVNKDEVLKAEILWTLKLITSHYSLNSSKNTSQLFTAMFPDSEIAKQFTCSERKASYLCIWLAEYFKKLLKDSVRGTFVFLFDESLNKKMQGKQMDVQSNEVRTRYFGSEFLGHGTADNLMDHFSMSVLESGLPVKDMIQVSMDGPNVNWKFFGDLKNKVNADYGTSLINIGSCGLHVVHNSFKRGINATGWQVSSFLSSLYYLFKDAPARKEDFATISGSTLMPLKFVSHRWLENVPVCQRALLIWDKVVLYVQAADGGKVSKPKNKSYEVVKDCVQDPCFVAKLHFFKCIASQLQPFLSKYQTDRPMIPFLADDLCMMTRSLMRRFIKKDVLQSTSDDKLVKIDVADQKIHLSYKRVDVGFASEKLNGTANRKPSERQVMEFRMESTTCLVELLKKLLEKCPITYSLVRHLSCLNPVKMASQKEACSNKFKKVLTLLLNSNRVEEKDCDTLLQQYSMFLDSIPAFGTNKFANFNSSVDGIDKLFSECMAGESYKNLFDVVKLLLVLSHGQASVERGFSINKEVEVENLKEKSLVAQRLVCDHVKSVGGLFNVELNKSLLLSVRLSRQKYEKYLEQEREKAKTVQEKTKRKSSLEEIEEIRRKRKRMDSDIRSLNEAADDLCTKAEATGKLTFVTQANALRRSAKDKVRELADMDESLKSKLERLKEL